MSAGGVYKGADFLKEEALVEGSFRGDFGLFFFWRILSRPSPSISEDIDFL